MTRLEAIQEIKDNSTCLFDLNYNKNNNTEWQLRTKQDCKTFVLVTYDGGEGGFDVYYPDDLNKTNDILDKFNNY